MAENGFVRKARVIIVDDTVDIRALLRIRLQTDGRFEVVGEAGDGEEAIALARDALPDAIVLDLAMPVMDGLQALPQLRRLVPNARIIVLSGFNGSEMADQALSLGADGYLEKGAAITHLVALLIEASPSGNGSPSPLAARANPRVD